VTDAKTVLMFSGQGSQYFQMGRALFDEDPVFRDSMLQLDELVRARSGRSVVATLYDASHSRSASFDQIALTHPAIFMVEYSLAETLRRSGIVPDITLGASLGSVAAATVAGHIDVEDALHAVIRQASVLEGSCKPGGMFAILADPANFEDGTLDASAEMAGVNFHSHFVIAARRDRFAQIEENLRKREMTFQRLPVSYAFHSQWIDEARAPFTASMRTIHRRTGRVPLMCCERVEPVSALPEDYFWNVVRGRIRFGEAIAKLERGGSYRYIDVGPASTLATFLKYSLSAQSKSTVHPILSAYGHDRKNLVALLHPTKH
jgi:acyl transferase domain-containing protein